MFSTDGDYQRHDKQHSTTRMDDDAQLSPRGPLPHILSFRDVLHHPFIPSQNYNMSNVAPWRTWKR